MDQIGATHVFTMGFLTCSLYSKCCSTISNYFEDLHVGVLGRGNLSAVGKVDVSLLGKRSVDVLVVDVLDHWLKREEFNYHFIENIIFFQVELTAELSIFWSVAVVSGLSQLLHFRLACLSIFFIPINCQIVQIIASFLGVRHAAFLD